MATRIFTRIEDDTISIAGEVFGFSALPSGKALRLTEMYGNFNLQEILDNISEGIDSETSNIESIQKLTDKIFSIRYSLIAFGLQISEQEDSVNYKRLKSAIDKASFPEIIWVIDNIMEINGLKHVEKMVKNLLGKLEGILPDLKGELSASLKRYLERTRLIQEAEKELEEVRNTGSTSLSSDLEENRFTSPINIS